MTLLAARARDFSLDLETSFAVTDGPLGANGHLARSFFKSSFSLRDAKTGPMVAEFRLRKLSFSEIIEATICARRSHAIFTLSHTRSTDRIFRRKKIYVKKYTYIYMYVCATFTSHVSVARLPFM